MTKLIKRITAPVLSLVFLLNMSSAGYGRDNCVCRSGVYF